MIRVNRVGPDPGADVRDQLAQSLPNLRAFAISLCRNVALADDLVQETILKAWSNIEKFDPQSNMLAWLFTILRNTYYSQYRKRGREVPDTDGIYSSRLATPPNQESSLDMSDFQIALSKLAPEHRDVLLMVGASGLSYEETAEICGVAVGTIKSRLNRARGRLADLLGIKNAADLGMGSVSEAVVRAQSSS